MKINLLTVFVILFNISLALLIPLPVDQDLCLKFHESVSYDFYFDFNVAEQIVISTLETGKIIKQFHVKEAEYQIKQEQPFKICFHATHKNNVVYTDIWKTEHFHVKQLAVVTEVEYLSNMIADVVKQVVQIAHIERLQMEISDSHANIVVRNERLVNTYGFVKVVLIFALIFMQLFLLKKVFLKDDSKLMI